ncbi:MAG: hypothetical protein KME03_13720 [Aphanocapsa lilacina HA4352-LM1]|nr:hypothetical protein [Aphanocapsa lilacina HA4352-LM1]
MPEKPWDASTRRLGEECKLCSGRYSHYNEYYPRILYAAELLPDDRTLQLSAQGGSYTQETVTFQNDLVWKPKTGSVDHTILFGLELGKTSGGYAYTFGSANTNRVPDGPLAGWGIGAGVFAVGERFGDLANNFVLPGYARVDAALYYRQGGLNAALNFKNLLGARYIDAAYYRAGLYPGAPFTVQGTLEVRF